jgi:hypothetical protein
MEWHEYVVLTLNVLTTGFAFWAIYSSSKAHRETIRETKLQASSNMVHALRERFDAPECRASRKRLASELLDVAQRYEDSDTGVAKSSLESQSATEGPRLDRDEYAALEILEQLGYLTKRGALDEGIVWSVFSWDVLRYVYALRALKCGNHLLRARNSSPTLYSSLEWLAEELRAFGTEQSGNTSKPLDWKQVQDFLIVEQGGAVSIYEPEH